MRIDVFELPRDRPLHVLRLPSERTTDELMGMWMLMPDCRDAESDGSGSMSTCINQSARMILMATVAIC